MEDKNRSILFLHGFTQNSIAFRNRLKVLLNSLEKNFKNTKFLFPDAPFILEDNEKIEEIKRGWLYLEESNKMSSSLFEKEKEVTYLGLGESLDSITKLNEENNYSIESIISFSQGSLVSTFLSILITHTDLRKKFPNLKCIILVAGFIYPMPKNKEIDFYYSTISKLYNENLTQIIEESEKIQIPTLHVFGKSDPYIIPDKSEKLINLFSNFETYIHEGKHFVPTKKEDVEAYINFLKKHLIN
jgi:predicted esterase